MAGSFIPPYNPNNVNVGVASSYVAPFSLTTPPVLPPDTQALGTVWPAPWTPLGASDGGLDFTVTRKTIDIMIEEQLTQVDSVTDSMTFDMDITLAEETLQMMKLAYGGGIIATTAPSTGIPGTRTLQISSDMDSFAFGFEVKNELGLWRRILVPKVKSIANVKTTFVRAKNKRMLQVKFSSLVAPEAVVIREMSAVAL